MTKSKVAPLAERLQVPTKRLSPFASYPSAELAVLEQAVADAMKTEDEAVTQGFADAVKVLPRPLRGRAAKLLRPQERRG